MERSLFATLWAGIEHRLRIYLAACVMDQGQVDDLAQKVALACWQKRGAFKEGQDFLAWVLGFARLEVLRGRRDRARDRHVLDEDLLATLESELGALAPELDERRHALEWCRAGLDRRARDLLEMAYGTSLPLAAVARKVGSSHAATAPTITAPQGGKIERVGWLVQLQPGAEVILRDPEPYDSAGVIRLACGRLIASVQEQIPDRSSAPSRAGRLTQLSVETACGGIVLEPGCKVEMTFASFNSPSGEPGKQLDVFVLAGFVMPPDLGPRPFPPQPVKAGTGIRLTKIGQGPVRVEQIPPP